MSDIHEGVTLGEGASSEEPLVERALEHLIDIVNHLIRREIAASAALTTAADHLDSHDLAQLALAIEAGHRDHIAALTRLVVDLGGEPSESSNLRSLLDRVRVRLRELAGDDGAVESLAAIEGELADQYRDAIDTVGFTDDERAIMAVGRSAAVEAVARLRAAH
jgi:uncharacterized protein (TIGR02284 family)